MVAHVGSRWTKAEMGILTERLAAGVHERDIAVELGRSEASVHCKVQRPNIRKSQQRLSEMFQATRPQLDMPEDPPPEYVLHEREIRLSIPRTTVTQVQFRDPLSGYSARDAKARGLSVQDALEICSLHSGDRGEIDQLAKAYDVTRQTITSVLNGSFFDRIISEAEIMWTPDRIVRLKYLWEEGHSCSAIGSEMGVSRNAVIGKVHRLGLGQRLPRISPEARETQRQKRNEARVVNQREARGRQIIAARLPEPKPLPEFVGSLRIPFADLRERSHLLPNQCRYIADGGPDFLACGNETLPGASYCPHCHNITHFKPMNISEEDRNRRAAQFRKMGRNPQVIITSPPIVNDAA
jgi:GcrA cell cycle regulator